MLIFVLDYWLHFMMLGYIFPKCHRILLDVSLPDRILFANFQSSFLYKTAHTLYWLGMLADAEFLRGSLYGILLSSRPGIETALHCQNLSGMAHIRLRKLILLFEHSVTKTFQYANKAML